MFAIKKFIEYFISLLFFLINKLTANIFKEIVNEDKRKGKQKILNFYRYMRHFRICFLSTIFHLFFQIKMFYTFHLINKTTNNIHIISEAKM